MKLRSNFSWLAVVFSVFLAACGPVPANYFDQVNQPNARRPDLPKVEVSVASLQGNWYSICREDEYQNGRWVSETWVIFGSSANSNKIVYADSDCRLELYRASTHSGFSISNELYSGTNANVVLLSNSQAVIDSFNSSRFCGSVSWLVGFPQSFANVAACGMDVSETKTIENYNNQQLFVVTSSTTIKYIKR